jgi:hypothetical protein
VRGDLCIVLVGKTGFLGIVLVRIARVGLWILLVRIAGGSYGGRVRG